MAVTFLESKNFYPSSVPNSSFQGEAQVEESNWLMAPLGEHGTRNREVNGNREVEPHKVPPEIEHVELQNEEHGDEEVENEEPKNIEYSQSPHSSVPEDPPPLENIPEVSTLTAMSED